MQAKRLVIGAAVVIVTIGGAVLLGAGAGNLLAERKEHDLIKRRAAFTQDILEQMENLQVGDTLPNGTLMDLDRNMVPLHSLLTDKSLVLFFDYSCENCLLELEHLTEELDSAAASHIILISGTNPLYLLDLREQYKLKAPILYDDHQRFMDLLGVNTFPFNLYVGKDGVIDSAVASPLGAVDFENFSQFVRQP
jgi:peroxiredoxin